MSLIDSFTGDYFFLSNFYLCTIPYQGITYPSTEHAYQAAKHDPKERSKFLGITAAQSKRIGRELPYNDKWWTTVKVGVMRELLNIKFDIPELEKKLLDTEADYLVEGNTWKDTFWGVCEGKGQNWLGRLLMEVRDKKIHKKIFEDLIE
jgi:ribA/ribD-fused uncharacterized protein